MSDFVAVLTLIVTVVLGGFTVVSIVTNKTDKKLGALKQALQKDISDNTSAIQSGLSSVSESIIEASTEHLDVTYDNDLGLIINTGNVPITHVFLFKGKGDSVISLLSPGSPIGRLEVGKQLTTHGVFDTIQITGSNGNKKEVLV